MGAKIIDNAIITPNIIITALLTLPFDWHSFLIFSISSPFSVIFFISLLAFCKYSSLKINPEIIESIILNVIDIQLI